MKVLFSVAASLFLCQEFIRLLIMLSTSCLVIITH